MAAKEKLTRLEFSHLVNSISVFSVVKKLFRLPVKRPNTSPLEQEKR